MDEIDFLQSRIVMLDKTGYRLRLDSPDYIHQPTQIYDCILISGDLEKLLLRNLYVPEGLPFTSNTVFFDR
jgi:hypothetical protein